MVDKAVLAAKIAAVQDAVARIRTVLPPDHTAFASDRDAREIVILNLFVALQECAALATHWLTDVGMDVPGSYRDLFTALGEREILPRDLASRLAVASGLRNLIVHRYGAIDWGRIHEIASVHLDDLLRYCEELSRRSQAQ